jgi:hypothetical protein
MELPEVLTGLPKVWRDNVGLLQNELLPYIWQNCGISSPTIISVWFEKKKGQDYNVFIPSPVYGPKSKFMSVALQRLEIPCRLLTDESELLVALAIKNVYVLTINIAGLEVGGTVGELWSEHNELARRVAGEIIDLQECLTGAVFNRKVLIDGMVEGIEGEPEHLCCGRSSPQRLERAMMLAERHGLVMSTIKRIYAQYRHA